MNRRLLAVGLASITLAGLAGWQHLKSAGIQSDIDALHKSQQHWPQDVQDQLDRFNKIIAELRQQLQDAQNQLAQANAVPSLAPAVNVPAGGNTMTNSPLAPATNHSQAAASPFPIPPPSSAAAAALEAGSRGKLTNIFNHTLEFGAPGLTEQNRALATAAMVGAITYFNTDSGKGKSSDEVNNEIDESVVEKMQDKMSPDQLKLLKDYFKYQRRSREARSVGR